MKQVLCVFMFLFSSLAAAVNLGDLLKGLGDAGIIATPSETGATTNQLSEQDISHGLKDALAEGATKAVSLLGRTDGFLKNEKVRIPLPKSLQQAESVFNLLGQGKQVAEFKTSLNRAAEAAVPEAKNLLVDAIKNMSVADAQGVLNGGDDAATQYFRRATEARLYERFLPIVAKTVNRYKLSEQYNQVAGLAAQTGLIGKEQANMAEYVTNKALDGLFVMIAEEESAIRRDPLGRSSAYVRKVFGSLPRN